MDSSQFTVPRKLAKMQVFGITLAMALSMLPSAGDRHLSCLELWAGVSSISTAASAHGMEATAMDLNRIPGVTDVKGPCTENILLKDGFMRALSSVLCLRPGGLLWMAPVCSSFVWMNLANCQRTKENPAGNRAYGPVRDGNRMASIASFFYALAMLIGAKPVVEQPSGSMMFSFQPLKKVIQEFKAQSVTCVRCAFTPGVRYGERFLKRYKFLDEGWVKGLHTKCHCPDQKHASLVTVGKKGDVTGKQKALKESQAYPMKLGEHVVHTYLNAVDCAGGSSTVGSSQLGAASSWKRPAAAQELDQQATDPKRIKTHSMSWKRPAF